MVQLRQMAVVLSTLLMCYFGSEEQFFKKVKYCTGVDGCSWHTPFFSSPPSAIASFEPLKCVPDVVKCLLWCRTNDVCLGFNYLTKGTCVFFDVYSFTIYPKKGCVFFEATDIVDYQDEAIRRRTGDVAYGRRTCQSSSAVVDNIIAGAWSLVSGHIAKPCARTNEPVGGSNWWTIDLVRPSKLRHVIFVTEGWNSLYRLENMIVAVTNTSWGGRGDPNSSLCCINRRPMAPASRYVCQCKKSILPGRYLAIQQGIMDILSPEFYFSLCSVEAYLD